MARGGKRRGVQGNNYSNRTDLTMNARPLPVMTPTDKPYGVAGQQVAAQRALPVAPPPPGLQPAVGEGSADARSLPGSFAPIDRPSERMNEPVTTGAALGAGAGLEALGLPSTSPTATLVSSLENMARISGSRDIAELAMRAQQIKDF